MLTAGATFRKFAASPRYRPVTPSQLRIVRNVPVIVPPPAPSTATVNTENAMHQHEKPRCRQQHCTLGALHHAFEPAESLHPVLSIVHDTAFTTCHCLLIFYTGTKLYCPRRRHETVNNLLKLLCSSYQTRSHTCDTSTVSQTN